MKSISLAHPPSFFTQRQTALQVRVRLTTVFRFRYPRRPGLAELFVLYEGTILAVVYDDSPLTYGFTWTWNRLLRNSYLHIPYRFLPRLFLCTPSFRRCGVTSAVCCGSGCFPLLPLESLSLLASCFSTLLPRRDALRIWSAVKDVGRA